MYKKRIKKVKEHFDERAAQFDGYVKKRVPFYMRMLEALVDDIPFPASRAIRAVDLGCGTGTVAYLIKKKCPKAKITCVDIAPNMIEQAKLKLAGLNGIDYDIADISNYKFDGKFDVIASSLALHHLEDDEQRLSFHKNVFRALKKGGIFINADIVLGSTDFWQSVNLEKWKNTLLKHLTEKEVEQNHKRYLLEDRPAVLLEEIENIKKAGYKHVDVFWKYYNFAVYGGIK